MKARIPDDVVEKFIAEMSSVKHPCPVCGNPIDFKGLIRHTKGTDECVHIENGIETRYRLR